MGQESSGEYDAYMMVDGEPVKIPKDLPEISLDEQAESLPENEAETAASVINELAKKIALAFKATGFDLGKIIEEFQRLEESMRVTAKLAEEAFRAIFTWNEENLEELEKRGVFDYEPTARKKKRERDRRMSAKMENAARFSRYDKGRLRWNVKRRTRPRARERAPPVGMWAAIHRKRSKTE